MDGSMLDAAASALDTVFTFHRLLMLGGGVLMGLMLGLIPGIGGLVGMALLLPFTYAMDTYTAFALLLGMVSVTGTSDTIPAVLFGVPGTAGAQATVLDGNRMAKNGEAGRALAAAYTASLLGGLIGAFILALSLPVLRPMILYIGSPELLALSIFGISMVAVLSGNAPAKGLAAAAIGIMLSLMGPDPQTGTSRWTFDTLYLWDGMPLVPLVLGFFALPEVADLAIRRGSIANEEKYDAKSGMFRGIRDSLKNWWLVVRCSVMGSAIGAIPGMGSSVVDWLAYGHAVHTEKDAKKTFGTGDVRGVIAPEAANNAITSGALIPTVAFGVPGSASMTILLGAFLVHGLVPGPSMLGEHLDLTYTMILSIALANILGAGICFAFSGAMAKIALLRFSLILPSVLIVTYVGAFQSSRSWGDLYVLLVFGAIGWTMKQLRWPRPPLILGFVLGAIIERYMFISVERYGLEWLTRPVVVILLGFALLGLFRPVFGALMRRRREPAAPAAPRRVSLRPSQLFHIAILLALAWALWQATMWPHSARIAPMAAVITAAIAVVLSLAASIYRPAAEAEAARHGHFDTSETHTMPVLSVLGRAVLFFGWLLAFMGAVAVIGFIPAVPLFVAAFMAIEGRERWRVIVPHMIVITLFVYVVFDQLLSLPWPRTLIGAWLPALKVIPSV